MKQKAYTASEAAAPGSPAGNSSASQAQSSPASSERQDNMLPSISLPRGGGAIRGMGEKFSVNPSTGAAALTVPLTSSPGRSEFGPQLTLSYDSASGNGPFGFGWSLSLPAITRKTDKGLPRYCDGEESDVFILAGAEDLVPILDDRQDRIALPRTVHGISYTIRLYRPRIEGLFARIDAVDQQCNRHQPLAHDHARQCHHAVWLRRKQPHRRS